MSRSLLSALALCSLLASLAPAAEPGYRQAAAKVDALLSEEVFQTSAGGTVELAPLADDEAFLRRVTLDVVGRSPSPAEITAFALDRSADKRSLQVERLLAQAGFGRNWARYWRDVIFYRRSDECALIAAPGAEDYLTERFNANAPWDADCAFVRHGRGRYSRTRPHGDHYGSNGRPERRDRGNVANSSGRANPMRPVPRPSDRSLECANNSTNWRHSSRAFNYDRSVATACAALKSPRSTSPAPAECRACPVAERWNTTCLT